MKTYLKLILVITAVSITYGAGLKESPEVTAEKKLESVVLYSQDFEKEDDTDAWSSDSSEIEWKEGGSEGSKGCMKVFKPGEEGYIVVEKYLNWYDDKTIIEFDYFSNGFNDELYCLARGEKAGSSVRANVKGWVKGKWGHAKWKAAVLAHTGKSGKADTFRNLVIVISGRDRECKDPYLMLDNIVIRTNGNLTEKPPVTQERK